MVAAGRCTVGSIGAIAGAAGLGIFVIIDSLWSSSGRQPVALSAHAPPRLMAGQPPAVQPVAPPSIAISQTGSLGPGRARSDRG